jgi:hypothetical protein
MIGKAAPIETRRREPRFCRFRFAIVLADGSVVWKPCGRPKCSMQCRDRWARRIAACLERSFREQPPSHHVCLRILGPISDLERSRALTGFLRRLRYQFKKRGNRLSYLSVKEWRHGREHYHLLLRTAADLSSDLIGSLWQASCREARTAHSFSVIRNVPGIARYLVKAVRDDAKKELPPLAFRGRILAYSNGFLARNLQTLWRESLAECRSRRGADKPSAAELTPMR